MDEQNETIESPAPQKPIEWENEMMTFFQKVGLQETARAFEYEMLVFSRHQQKIFIQSLEEFIENLLTWFLQQTATEHLKSERKRSASDAGLDDLENYRQVERMDPEQIQIRATNNEIKARIDAFIQKKRSEVDASNRVEFVRPRDSSSEDVTCARTDAREINRNIQMKLDVANNESEELLKSIGGRSVGEKAKNEQVEDEDENMNINRPEVGIEERVKNLEEHLNVVFVPSPQSFTLIERIKAIEEHIMYIEREHPAWAAVYFNQPDRQFPPPPPQTVIKKSTRSISPLSTTGTPLETKRSVERTTPFMTTGRGNSSLTRAVLEQMARRQQQ